MHIGVMASNWGEHSGGAYTLENELFDALLTGRLPSQHRFTALIDSRTKRCPTTYPTVNLAEARGGLGKRLLRKSRRLVRAAGQHLGLGKTSHSVPWLDKALSKHGIEFVIALNPFEVCMSQPYLVYTWDLEHRKQPFFPEVRGDVWLRREEHFTQVLGQAAYVVAGTREGAAEIERFYGVHPKRIRVIPFPTPRFALEPIETNEVESALPQLSPVVPFLFYPAGFWAHKNHITALKVLQKLRAEHHLDVNLVLVGSDHGNLAHVQAWIRRLELEKHVIYAGFVSRAQLVWLYRNALALFYPSLFGPDNLPPLEAFALGCPVMASAIDGAAEQLGDAAVLCDPVDVTSFAAAAAAILKDSSRREELIKRGKARAARWTHREATCALLAVLDEFAAVRDNWGT